MIIWFTGQPFSGKTTLANTLIDYLENMRNRRICYIDGDDLRKIIRNKDYSETGRRFNVEVAQSIAIAAESQSHISDTVVSMVSPYREQREFLKKTHNVREIYLTSKRVRSENYVVSNYEPPLVNFLQIDTDSTDIEKSLKLIINYIDTPICYDV